MTIHSGLHPHLRKSPARREMQPLSKGMEVKRDPAISHDKGWRAASPTSSGAGTKPCHSFKDAMP